MERNNLYPVFLKLEELNTLIVGGGNVALEKLSALLKSSPLANLTLVAESIHHDIADLAAENPNVALIRRPFCDADLDDKDLLILATDDRHLHEYIRNLAKTKRLLVNVADTPELCDFYLGSVVTKGSVKIGISTNGKSPTFAKRLREFFEEILPDDTEDLLQNLQSIRNKIKGDLRNKVRILNEVTRSWLRESEGKK
jgi:precorrin-2 dehydrogenase / sirohydrochlorin ferrochelatase